MPQVLFDHDINLNYNAVKFITLHKMTTVELPDSPPEGFYALDTSKKLVSVFIGGEYKHILTTEGVSEYIQGLSWKDEVKAISTSNVTIGTDITPANTIDGVTLEEGDRVLLVGQDDASENGIWVSSSTPYRSEDMNETGEFNNAIVPVNVEGTEYGGTWWRCTSVDVSVGSDNINFSNFLTIIPTASETVEGKARIATNTDIDEGISDIVIVSPVKLEYRLNPIENDLALLKPAPPDDLSGKDLQLSLYTAIREGTTSTVDDCTDNTTPRATVDDVYDGDTGEVSSWIDGSEQDAVTLSEDDDSGVYGTLEIINDEDPYAGVDGKEGFYKQLDLAIQAESGLSVDLHSYQLKHSKTGDSNVLEFYVDDPQTPVVQNIGLTLPNPSTVRYISGVPSMDVGENILTTFEVAEACNTHYNDSLIAEVNSSSISDVDLSPGDEDVTPVNGTPVSYTDIVASIIDNAYSENVTLDHIGYNSIGTASFTVSQSSGLRVDTVSDESIRVTAEGDVNYPNTGYGNTYDSTKSIKSSGDSYDYELQLLNGKFQRPTGNYTGMPAPYDNGEDYSTGMDTYERRACFEGLSISNATSLEIQINGAENFSGAETSGLTLYIKVEGETGWLDANTAYPGTGDPSNDGDACLVYSESDGDTKKVTFGSIARSGQVYVLVGLPDGSTKKFSDITIQNVQ